MLRGLLAWSLKHGHFLIMGGFHLVEPGTSIAQLEAPPDGVYLKRQLTNAERNVEGVSDFFAAVSIPSLISNRSEVNLSGRS